MVDRQRMMSVRDEGVSGPDRNESDLGKTVLRFVMHSALAAIGGVILGFVLLSFVHLHPVGPHWRLITLLADVPYSPAFWGSALLLGFFVDRRMGDRSALWVGPAGLMVLAAIVLISVSGGGQPGHELAPHQDYFSLRRVAGDLFGVDPNLCGGDECLGRLFYTTPALNSVAYSLGAFLGLRARPTLRPERTL
jgi:hypothetical protein